MTTTLRCALALFLLILTGCAAAPDQHAATPAAPGMKRLSGHLLLIGGGLDDDNKPVYHRFIELACGPASGGPPRIVIATAASGDQPVNAAGKTESIRAYCPAAKIDVIMRETPTEQTVTLIDQATAMFFTGGDQKRITDRYRPGGAETPESVAMRRLLDRGGVIAGTSAGDAMMSDPMFLTGRSAEALGFVSTRTDPNQDADAEAPKPGPKEPPVLGPQIGPGMGFLPWAFADSHFFERHRFGRLVAALEVSRQRLGIGVGEDAAVEVDLATGELIGISVADSLLVDAGALQREGLTRRGIRARVITQGMRVSLTDLLASPPPPVPSGLKPRQGPPGSPDASPQPQVIPTVEPGQNRQLSSWRFFTRAQTPPSSPNDAAGWVLRLDGYEQFGRADPAKGRGPWSLVEIRPAEGK